MIKTVKHPCLDFTLTFTDTPYHSYHDQHGTRYTSVSAFTQKLFSPFDAPAAAARVAARTGEPQEEVLAHWKEKGRRATDDIGTPVHEYAEAIIMGRVPPSPASDVQRHMFPIVDQAVTMISRKYDTLAVEQIIFDPLWDVAGTVDWLLRTRDGGILAILDWKTCEVIGDDAWGRTAYPPLDYVPASKLAHYTMQLSTYAWLLTDPGYSSYAMFLGVPVELALIHVPHPGMGEAPVWRPLAYWPQEVEVAMMTHRPGGPKPRKLPELDAVPNCVSPRSVRVAPKDEEEDGPI